MNILIDGIISVMIIKCVAHQAALRANVVETEGFNRGLFVYLYFHALIFLTRLIYHNKHIQVCV